MISGMDYKCANELVEYLSVPITEDDVRNIIPKKQYDFHQKSILIRDGWKIFHYMRFAICDIIIIREKYKETKS